MEHRRAWHYFFFLAAFFLLVFFAAPPFLAALRFLAIRVTSFHSEIVQHRCKLSKKIFEKSLFSISRRRDDGGSPARSAGVDSQ